MPAWKQYSDGFWMTQSFFLACGNIPSSVTFMRPIGTNKISNKNDFTSKLQNTEIINHGMLAYSMFKSFCVRLSKVTLTKPKVNTSIHPKRSDRTFMCYLMTKCCTLNQVLNVHCHPLLWGRMADMWSVFDLTGPYLCTQHVGFWRPWLWPRTPWNRLWRRCAD